MVVEVQGVELAAGGGPLACGQVAFEVGFDGGAVEVGDAEVEVVAEVALQPVCAAGAVVGVGIDQLDQGTALTGDLHDAAGELDGLVGCLCDGGVFVQARGDERSRAAAPLIRLALCAPAALQRP